MDDIGDYLYIIVLAIAGLSSLFKKKKKTDEAKTVQAPVTNLEDILRELDEKDYESYPQAEPTFENTTINPPKPAEPLAVEYETVKDYMANKNRAKRLQKAADIKADPFSNKNAERKKRELAHETIRQEEENKLSNEQYFNISTVDEAKRAFVYAEIFNRKYT